MTSCEGTAGTLLTAIFQQENLSRNTSVSRARGHCERRKRSKPQGHCCLNPRDAVSPELAGGHNGRAAAGAWLVQAQLRGGRCAHCGLVQQPQHLQVPPLYDDGAPN